MGALPLAELRRLTNGYQVTQAIHVAAVLGIPALLVGGPRSSDELAEAAGAHAPSLYRLLRALAGIGVFEEQEGRFALTPVGEALHTELGAWAEFVGSPPVWASWGDLVHSIRTGENAFMHVHGVDVWRYRAERPDESELFDRAMTGNTRAIAAAVTGSFFEEVPNGADAYVLKDIVHDWEDPEATQVLRVVRAAMKPEAVVLLVEKDIEQPEARFSDLNMLVNPGGRERTVEEYRELLADAGLELTGVTPTASLYAVFQAENARSK